MICRRLPILAAGIAAALAAGATATAAGTEVTLADKGFNESRVVTQVYAQALRARGFTVTLRNMVSTFDADAAITAGEIDAYFEYTGTALLTVLRGRPSSNAAVVYRRVRTGYAARGLAALTPSPFRNDNKVACTRAAVRRHGLSTLSSLATAAPRISYAANTEHLTRDDGLPVLTRRYGIRFGHIVRTPIDDRYGPIRRRTAQCVYAFGTDPEILRLKLVVLRDDRAVFQGTPYQSFPVVRQAFLDSTTPAFTATVDAVSAALTDTAVRGLNSRVTLDGQDPAAVAADFLRASGLG